MMDTLNLSETELEILPDFSQNSMKTLNLSWNYLRILYEGYLPDSLEDLNLEGNFLGTDGLLQVWPRSLQVLNLSRNVFSSLEEVFVWPNSLRVLNLSHTNLQILDCSQFPESLEDLDISYTFVSQLSSFPTNLKRFRGIFTELKSLPSRCPESLESFVLSCGKHPVGRKVLPSYWGTALQEITITSCNLKGIPAGLPETLKFANFSNNSIQKIPDANKFPQGVKILHLGKNRITEIPNWLANSSRTKFTIHNNRLTVKPNYPNCLTWYSQFIGENYSAAAKKIQKCWRIHRIFPPVRTWKRMKVLKEDLLALAMCPERAGRFENISPEWNYVYDGPV